MMERGRWQTPQQLIRRQKSLFHVELGLSAPSLCIPISLSSISLYKETFSSSSSSCEWCVCCVGPASVGMRNAPSSPPGGLFLRVYVCVCVCWMPPFCVLYLAKTRLPVFSRPVQPERVKKKKKKGKKFLLFFLFFLYHLWCGCPLPSRGYIAPPCAPCRYQTVFFSLLLLSSIHFDR